MLVHASKPDEHVGVRMELRQTEDSRVATMMLTFRLLSLRPVEGLKLQLAESGPDEDWRSLSFRKVNYIGSMAYLSGNPDQSKINGVSFATPLSLRHK